MFNDYLDEKKNKKSRIILITSEFFPGPVGIGNHAFCLPSGLSKKSFEICVIVHNEIKKALDEILINYEN